jgi:F0F1-type ATP synthase membrane subunit b/b'
VSPALANFLFEATNFLLLAAALGWILFKPIRRALDAERARHERDEDEAQRRRDEARSLTDAARAAVDTAERDIDERRREILASARREALAIVERAREAAATDQRRLEHQLAIRRKAEATQLAEAVGRLAAESVRRLLRTLEGPALDLALVRAARVELASLPSQALKSALVECARPLDAESRRILQSLLGEGLNERVVGELGAGVRITTPAGQVDATAISLARRAVLAVKDLAEPAGGAEARDA